VRILYLALDIELGKASGEAAHVREATRALAAIGEEIHLVVPEIAGKPQKNPRLAAQGVHLHSVPARGNTSTVLACRRLVKNLHPDVIYERRYSPKIGAAVSVATGVPLVVEVNGLADVESATLRKVRGTARPRTLRSALRRRFYARASYVVAVDSGIAKELHERYGVPTERIVVVANGADVDRFAPQDPVAARRQIGLPPSVPVVGFVGTLEPWQGLGALVRAAPEVLASVPETRFLIVGDGPVRSEIETAVRTAGCAGAFQFTGLVEHERVPLYLAASDVCLSLRDIELQVVRYGYSPLKLYEYLASGRAVVATPAEGLEFLKEEGCGVFVDLKDPKALATTISDLLLDAPRRKAMGERGRAIAVRQFSWQAVAGRLVAVMRRAVRG